MVELAFDVEAFERIDSAQVTGLTARATAATFHVEGLTPEQVAANRRIVDISADQSLAACANPHQLFAAAFVGQSFAGYMIATVHGDEDRELDWLMVDPAFHGSGVAAVLMNAGIDWLGAGRPLWLNVIRHNERAIRFYRRFGFEIDPLARTDHVVPHAIMRRRPAA